MQPQSKMYKQTRKVKKLQLYLQITKIPEAIVTKAQIICKVCGLGKLKINGTELYWKSWGGGGGIK